MGQIIASLNPPHFNIHAWYSHHCHGSVMQECIHDMGIYLLVFNTYYICASGIL